MRIFFCLLLLLPLTLLHAQQYEKILKKCIDNFQDGLGQFTKERSAAEVERRYTVLNECMKGQKFPAFSLTTYKGNKYSSTENANKVVLLHFWSTKSPTCVAAIPLLNELFETYKDKDFIILSFSSEELGTLNTFLSKHRVRYNVFGKSKNLINHQFSTVLGYPTNILLNKKGEIAEYKVGSSLKPEELKKTKEALVRAIEFELGN